MKWALIMSLICGYLLLAEAGRGGRGRKKGKGKNLLPFGNVMEYSLVSQNQRHPRGAYIIKGSHFNQVNTNLPFVPSFVAYSISYLLPQIFRLGYKILLICLAGGDPRPEIKWYKDGSELYPRVCFHVCMPVS